MAFPVDMLRMRNPTSAFNPFAGGIAGAWYDPSDLTTVFQDTAGTTPSAVGDPVGRINDKSGNAHHLLQATAGKRPTLRQTGSLYYLDFVAASNQVLAVASTGFILNHPNEIALACRLDKDGNTLGVNHIYDGFDSDKRHTFFWNSSGYMVWPNQTTDIRANLGIDTEYAIVNRHNGNASSYCRKNGMQYNGGVDPLMNIGGLRIGNYQADSNPFDGRIYAFLIRDTLFNSTELAAVETYLASKLGIVLTGWQQMFTGGESPPTSTGWNGWAFRQRMPASALPKATGSQIRFTLKAGASNGIVCDEAWFGPAGVGSIDFDGTQTQLKFGGSNSGSCAANGTLTTDGLTHSYSGNADLLVEFHFNGATDLLFYPTFSMTNQQKNTAPHGATSAGTGWTNSSSNNAFQKIEVFI